MYISKIIDYITWIYFSLALSLLIALAEFNSIIFPSYLIILYQFSSPTFCVILSITYIAALQQQKRTIYTVS